MQTMSHLRPVAAALAVATFVLSLPAHAELKVGYVDLQRALQEVEEGRAAQSRLKGLLEGKQKELDKEQETLKKEGETLEKQASAMSEETRVQKQRELERKALELQQKWMKGQQEMKGKEQEELRVIFAKMDPIIASIAQRENITMVFDKSNSGLVYAPSSLDLTNELVRLYNSQHGGKGTGGSSKKADVAKKDAK